MEVVIHGQTRRGLSRADDCDCGVFEVDLLREQGTCHGALLAQKLATQSPTFGPNWPAEEEKQCPCLSVCMSVCLYVSLSLSLSL